MFGTLRRGRTRASVWVIAAMRSSEYASRWCPWRMMASSGATSERSRRAFYAMWHNFARIHQPLCVTPAMEAGIADHVWTAAEIAKLAK